MLPCMHETGPITCHLSEDTRGGRGVALVPYTPLQHLTTSPGVFLSIQAGRRVCPCSPGEGPLGSSRDQTARRCPALL